MPTTLYSGSSALPSSHAAYCLIHGGAGPEDPKGEAANEAARALRRVLNSVRGTGYDGFLTLEPSLSHSRLPIFHSEKSALLAARLLELEPLFNAGYGAALQSDGYARVSASFMESTRRTLSAVTNVCDVVHPSELAYYLQHERFSMLDSAGATRLARRLRVPEANLVTTVRFERWVQSRRETLETSTEAPLGTGTIGCVSVDSAGRLAAVTSTGGVGNEAVGRMGDTPTVAGNYCTESVAVSCTGYGEQIVNQAFAARVAVRCQDGATLHAAMAKSLEEAAERGYGLAAIALGLDQEKKTVSWAAGTTESYFVWAGHMGSEELLFSGFIS